ncbi:hypothetical protein TanjilG_28362 [Lupinus angustifolius]|uniref:Transmembrane protein n=1 Tax=Lupinus angustifolius TaxID=3871 RepID=A0A4P1RID8_LUPAN|nr:hypothetical protein TanjilG_28362 [Lupinus angustifolius]
MAFSYNKILLIIVLIIMAIFVASPQGGVEGRPLLSHFQWSREYGLLFQALPNGSAPGSGGSNDHP